jgi:preprotein translocase subunit Sss1
MSLQAIVTLIVVAAIVIVGAIGFLLDRTADPS